MNINANKDGAQFTLESKKGSSVISAQGVQYQGKDVSFFAAYEEIENFYKFGNLFSILYKGKEYQLNADDRHLLNEAFEFGKQRWEEVRKGMPAMRVAHNDTEPVYTAETLSSVLKVYATHCVLSAKRNAVNLLLMDKFFNGEKKYYYTDLTSVQYRVPGKITDGFLEFEYPGSRSGKNASSYSSENSITFGKQHTPLVEEIYRFIDNAIRSRNPKQASAPRICG